MNDSWIKCGEGFSVTNAKSGTTAQVKFSTRLSRPKNRSTRFRQECLLDDEEDSNEEIFINCNDISPQKNKRKSTWSKTKDTGLSLNHTGCMQDEQLLNEGSSRFVYCKPKSRMKWKTEAFIAKYEVPLSLEDTRSTQDNEIECVSSSSDEELASYSESEGCKKAILASKNGQNQGKAFGIKRKLPRSEANSRGATKSKASCKASCIANNPITSRSNDLKETHFCDSQVQLNQVECDHLSTCAGSKLNRCKIWTLPSFSQGSAVAMGTLKGSQLKKGKNSTFKPKGAGNLHKDLKQESPGFISDVESDSDQESACNKDSSEFQHQRANKCLKSSLVSEPDGTHGSLDSPSEISSTVSASPCPSPQKEAIITASEWITAFQKQKTPVKSENNYDDSVFDSAKKRKKCISGSLVDRVTRLQRRLKSSVRFWNHSVTLNVKSANSITVILITVDKLYSLYLCKCQIVTDVENKKECKVLFTKEAAGALNLKMGLSVQIFPPWQQLVTTSDEVTILCTNYLHVLSPREASNNTEVLEPNGKENFNLQEQYMWTCPCTQDLSLPTASCPAGKPSSMPFSKKFKEGLSSETNLSIKQCSYSLTTISSSLHSINCMNSLCFGCTEQANSMTETRKSSSRTFLESKELLKCSSDVLPPFSATVIRVFKERYAENRALIRHKVLMKDSSGTIVLAILSPVLPAAHHSEPKMIDLCSSNTNEEVDMSWSIGRLELKKSSCTGFTVASRIARDLDPSLFSVLKKVWEEQGWAPSQGNRYSEKAYGGNILQVQPSTCNPSTTPNFAYILHSYPGSVGGQVLRETVESGMQENQLSKKENGLNVLHLHKVLKSSVTERLNFVAQVAISLSDQDDDSRCSTSVDSLYIYESEVDANGYTVVHKLNLNGHFLARDVSSSLCYFRDVCYTTKVGLHCDGYSLILPQCQWSSWGLNKQMSQKDMTVIHEIAKCTLKVPYVGQDTQTGAIVSLEGQIIGVDEESACMIEECKVCGFDLITQESGAMHCSVCNRNVTDSISIMNMTAYLKSERFDSNTVIKVQLAQKTIDSVLPKEADDDGYDVELVLGKTVTCRACLVESNLGPLETESKRTIYLKELILHNDELDPAHN